MKMLNSTFHTGGMNSKFLGKLLQLANSF